MRFIITINNMKEIFELITNFVTIVDNDVWNGIILCVIELISFFSSFGIVGIIFDFFGKYDSDLMSGLHWFFRILIFLGLSWLIIAIIKFIKTYYIAIIVVLIGIIGVILIAHYIKYRYSKKKRLNNASIETPIVDSKEICPRCGGKLVKRHGPYGDFYGCENFSNDGCKYTRKFK